MTDTAISILQKAADLGLKLGLKQPDRLTVESAKCWPRDFADTLQDYKPRLIALLRMPFVMVYSARLGETVFFCEDDTTRDILIEAGASPWSIYTKAELRTLCEQNRVAPLSDAELKKVHEIKRTFGSRIPK